MGSKFYTDQILYIKNSTSVSKVAKSIITFSFAAFLLIYSEFTFPKEEADTDSSMLLTECGLEKKEKEFALQLVNHIGQKHVSLSCNPLLQKFAESRAKDMAMRGYFSHVNPDNLGPNVQLEELGYILPDSYRDGRANNIESIAGGLADPIEALEGLLESTPHRKHLLGLNDFYKQQNEFGIGYYYKFDSLHQHFWVVIIARKKTPEDPDLICTPPPGHCYRIIL